MHVFNLLIEETEEVEFQSAKIFFGTKRRQNVKVTVTVRSNLPVLFMRTTTSENWWSLTQEAAKFSILTMINISDYCLPCRFDSPSTQLIISTHFHSCCGGYWCFLACQGSRWWMSNRFQGFKSWQGGFYHGKKDEFLNPVKVYFK